MKSTINAHTHKSQVEKIFVRVATLIISITALLGLYYFYLLFFPSTVLFITSDINPQKKVVKMGETIQVKFSYCKKVSAISTIVRNLVSSDGRNITIPLSEVSSTAPVGCGKFYIPVPIPTDIPSGDYRANISFEYQANAVRTVFEEIKSEPFRVEK